MRWIQLVGVYSDVTMEPGLHGHIAQVRSFFSKIENFFLSSKKIETPRCSLLTLNNFVNDLSATNALEISSQDLSYYSGENNEILNGSYALFICNNGYQNIDGNLKVTCNANGQWSAFPSCIPLSTTITH